MSINMDEVSIKSIEPETSQPSQPSLTLPTFQPFPTYPLYTTMTGQDLNQHECPPYRIPSLADMQFTSQRMFSQAASLPIFEGKPEEDVRHWLKTYELSANANNWDDNIKFNKLIGSLRGYPNLWYLQQ